MKEIEEGYAICPYCGQMMDALNKQQIKIFGKPTCCGYEMLVIDRGKIHNIVRALEKLKENIEKEILSGIL